MHEYQYLCLHKTCMCHPLNNSSVVQHFAEFHTCFLPGGGSADACKGYMHTSVHPLDFNEILDIFKNKKCQILLYYAPYCSNYDIIVFKLLGGWGGGGSTLCMKPCFEHGNVSEISDIWDCRVYCTFEGAYGGTPFKGYCQSLLVNSMYVRVLSPLHPVMPIC